MSLDDITLEQHGAASKEIDNSLNHYEQQEKSYPGDYIDDTPPPETGYNVPLHFPNAFLMLCFFDKDIADGFVTPYPWQRDELKLLTENKFDSKKPLKYCLIGSNGSGKDKFIIAPFSIFFILTKIRSRVIVTTSSGTQLTSQTEPYIKDLAEKINAHFGTKIFHIRQRYIKCLLTGSEVRMFATDESGKAEGYHPIDPYSEMAIIVNEGKSVTEDIHRALRRCTGFNYWLEISSAGEPKGYLYYAATHFKNPRYITSYDCPHVSKDEIEEDKQLDGEHSAFFRSKHLSQFTSIEGQAIIPLESINECLKTPPTYLLNNWPLRVGIDLAAGGDENVIHIQKGNKSLKEFYFREKDTVIGARRIDEILTREKIDKEHQFIFADDGGIGRGIIDQLVSTHGWTINRVMNQWAALGNKKQYGNRGAENWYRIKRIIEERFYDLNTLSQKCLHQLGTRYYKQSLTGGRIFLEEKKEAKAHGRPSPDRADAFILSLTGLTVEEFIKDSPHTIKASSDDRPKDKFSSQDAILAHYENKVTFENFNGTKKESLGSKVYNSLRKVLAND